MREYETILVLDAALDTEAVEVEISRVVKMIEDKKGVVREIQRWGRRRLAYPIKKKPDGVYTYVRYEGGNEVLEEIDRRCSLNESLLRHMTVVIDHRHGVVPSWAQSAPAAESGGAPGDEPSRAERPVGATRPAARAADAGTAAAAGTPTATATSDGPAGEETASSDESSGGES